MENIRNGNLAEGLASFSRKIAAEGIVLLKNENEVLPLTIKDRVSVFGRCQIEYYRSGTGSGGAVNSPYKTNLIDALRKSKTVGINEELAKIYEEWLKENPFDNGGGGWAAEPWCQKEMPITNTMAAKAAAVSDKAIIVIGRTAGEDKDNKPEEGSYYLTQEEMNMLQAVVNAFENVIVVLNVGNIIDMSFLNTLAYASHIKAVLYAWHGGMEGGNAVVDVLTGRVPAQGKLADTIAYKISDYPADKNHGNDDRNIYAEDIYVGYRYFETFDKNAVMYPFGYGLAYTEFAIEAGESYSRLRNDVQEFVIEAFVTNKGTKYPGREVVQVYVESFGSKLGRAARELVGFQKTGLILPGKTQEVEIVIPLSALSSYDDTGETGHKNAFVVEEGEYIFHIGNSVRDTVVASIDNTISINIEETVVIEQCKEAMAPIESFKRLRPGTKKADGTYREEYESVPLKETSLHDRILGNLPPTYEITGDKGYTLQDVADQKVSMEEFIAQLNVSELAAMVRGEGMCSAKVTPGTASAFGGVTDRLLRYGIPIGCCADGPSGVRMDSGFKSTQLPIGTCIACTWDPQEIEELFTMQAKELVINKIDTLLGPGMNLHRHPLNGRNFEYYSEDPLITGKMAAATVKGTGSNGVFSTIKHFACNSQEHHRHMIEAVVSQRALREIYLKGFEIAVKEGKAKSLMTSYNPINGYWSASNYDLVTTILRNEWGYDGLVMTDWWATMNDAIEGGEAFRENTAGMIRSQNDVFMVVNNNGAELNGCNDNTESVINEGRLTVGELQRCAMNICSFLMKTPAFIRFGTEKRDIPLMKAVDYVGGVSGQKLQDERQIDLNNATQRTDKWFYSDREETVGVVVKIMYDYSNIAQTVCKATLNGQDLITFQTNGTNGRWIFQKLLRVKLEKGWYHLDLDFVKPGMQVAYMEFCLED